jgi:hypothetical protein
MDIFPEIAKINIKNILGEGLTNCFVKGQLVNIFSFMGPSVSVKATEFCHYSMKAAIGNR